MPNLDDIQIVPIVERLGDVRAVAQWIVDEWGDGSLDETVHQLMNDENCPPTLVAVLDDAVVGVVDFRRYQSKSDIAPTLWVNVFYVDEAFRGVGVGSMLLARALENARAFDEPLFVYTDVPTFYEERGWRLIEDSDSGASKTLQWQN